MSRKAMITCTVAVLLAAGSARADATEEMANATKRTKGALVMLQGLHRTELTQSRLTGMAVCIRSDGIFMTFAMGVQHRTGKLEDLKLTLPGIDGKTVKAELLGIDPTTSIGFVKALEGGSWNVVPFATRSMVKPGQRVVSVGLTGADQAFRPRLGLGYVSTVLRVPGKLAYITGGKLTKVGSPVFSGDGPAIGIVGRTQPFLNYETVTSKGTGRLPLRGADETGFFAPVEEFIHSFTKDSWTRRLPWIGVKSFDVLSEPTRDLYKLKAPGVMVGTVYRGQPADKAGLSTGDVIVAVNGKPLTKLATPAYVAQNFKMQFMRLPIGKPVVLKVLRQGDQEKTVNIVPVPWPKRPSEAQQYVSRRLAVAVREKVMMDAFISRTPAEANTPGLVVLLASKRGPAYNAGLQGGDIITSMNREPVQSVEAVKALIDSALAAKPPKPINLVVQRGEQTRTLSILVPSTE